jgi:iron(III) transport system substrate-binding protein
MRSFDATRRAFALSAAAAGLVSTPSAVARPPSGYPRSYQRVEEAGAREGALLVYSAADLNEVDSLLAGFRRRYPKVRLRYVHLPSREVYARFVSEVARGQPSADLLFNSAMDLQIKLVNDGYAQAYASPEKPALPAWAVWKNQAYGVTAEPIVFAYNRRLLSGSDVPRSHVDLERLLRTRASVFQGRVATYDVERSSTGFLFFTQDEQLTRDTWKLLRALGRTRTKFYISGEEILQRVSSGEYLIAYNMMSSYVLEKRATDPTVEIVFPSDYTLVMSRIAFISKEARHPAAARLFLDYLMSREGQGLLARRYMTPVRNDLPLTRPHADPEDLRAIHVGPVLLAGLDRMKSAKLIAQWKAAVGR